MKLFFYAFLLWIFVQTALDFGFLFFLFFTIWVVFLFFLWKWDYKIQTQTSKTKNDRWKYFYYIKNIKINYLTFFLLSIIFWFWVSYIAIFWSDYRFQSKIDLSSQIQKLYKNISTQDEQKISNENKLTVKNTKSWQISEFTEKSDNLKIPKWNNYKLQSHNIWSENSNQEPIVLSYFSGKIYYNFVGPIKVIWQDKPNRFIIEDFKWRQYLLYRDDGFDYHTPKLEIWKKYIISDRIVLNKNISHINQKIENVKNNWEFVSDYYLVKDQIYTQNIDWESDNFFKDKIIDELQDIYNYEFDFDNWMMMKWYYGVFYDPKILEDKDYIPNLWFIQKVRQKLINSISNIYSNSPNAGLYLWMLIWDKSMIDKQNYENFVNSGIVHIVAVSGWNIVMVLIFLWFLFRWIPFYLRLVILSFGVVFYVLLCGNDSSVIRAGIMWILWIFALFVGREISIRRSMAYTVFFMLLQNPYLLTRDVWFLLSFGAIFGIIWSSGRSDLTSYQNISKNKKLTISNKIWFVVRDFFVDFIKNYLYPTLGATIGTLPFILFFMTKTNLVWIIGNLLIIPFVPIVMIYGFISPILANLSDYFVTIWYWITGYIFWISHIATQNWIYIILNSMRIRRTVLWFGLILIIWFVTSSQDDVKLDDRLTKS